jgi:hypothetical protein
LIPITSTPACNNEKAAEEITALAAGAGPPENRIATRLMELIMDCESGNETLVDRRA